MKNALIIFLLIVFSCFLVLSGCGEIKSATIAEEKVCDPIDDPVGEDIEQEEIDTGSDLEAEKSLSKAFELKKQYFYDEAIELLSDEAFLEIDEVQYALNEISAEKESLVNYSGDIPHIFFHSLIVYPELVFTDTDTPMGGYNSGFSEKAELEKILPQLYERGYVLYDLDSLYQMSDGEMVRNDILLPTGKRPLILSVDDVAYAYGEGFAEKLFVDEDGSLMYIVPNPEGGTDIIPDGDVMGVIDSFVREHPDFSYQGHKGTIALTGFQGAFGYYPYRDDAQYDMDPAIVQEITAVVDALKADGWNFASHSYTHNGVNNYYCFGCSYDKIYYDINKWILNVSQYTGKTRLFIAPFGYRVEQPALQAILDAGFEIYCTVDDKIYNEVNEDYFLMSRIEISGYSMTYYKQVLNDDFFDPDSVFDSEGRPPVI